MASARSKDHPLAVFFTPKSVAVIEADETPGSEGRTVLWNLISSQFGGTVYPVSYDYTTVLGIKAYRNIAAVPEHVDLAVIASPAAAVPGIIAECSAAGVKGAIILSGGLKECGREGLRLEQEVMAAARSGGLRIIGPNSLGVLSPLTGINASAGRVAARPGRNAGNYRRGTRVGEFAVLISDQYQNKGLGKELVRRLLEIGRQEKIERLVADILPDNRDMLRVSEKLGFRRDYSSEAGVVKAEITL